MTNGWFFMIILYREVNIFKLLSIISFSMALLVLFLFKLPNYYQIPTIAANLEGCSEHSTITPPFKVLQCSFIDKTGYHHVVKGYSLESFKKMLSESANKEFIIKDSRYEFFIDSLIVFSLAIIYFSTIFFMIMTPIIIHNKNQNKVERDNFMHIDAWIFTQTLPEATSHFVDYLL